MAQNGGKYGKQQSHNHRTPAVSGEPLPLGAAKNQQRPGAGDIDKIGIDRGGKVFPDHSSQQYISSHSHRSRQCQQIALQMRPAAGIGKGNQRAACQRHADGGNGFSGKLSLHKQPPAQAHPDHLGTDDGGGAGNGGMLQRFKPGGKMSRQKYAAEDAQDHLLFPQPPQLFAHRFAAKYCRSHKNDRP